MERLSFFLRIHGVLFFVVWAPSLWATPPSPKYIDSLRAQLQKSTIDTSRVGLLLALGHAFVMKSGELARDLDTAYQLSLRAYALSHKVTYHRGKGLSYLLAAKALRERGYKQKAWQFTEKAQQVLNRYGYAEDLADVYMVQALFYSVSDRDLSVQIQLYERAIPLLSRSANTVKLAEALKYRGDLYQLQSHNLKALQDLHMALKLYRSIGYTKLQELYDLLGFVYSKMGDYEAGLNYGLLALQTVEAARDTNKLAKVYSRLGITYYELNQPEKALIYFHKSLRAAQKQYRPNTIILLGTTISAILNSCDAKALNTLRIQDAVDHLEQVIQKLPNTKKDIDCQLAIATCYVNYYSKLKHDYTRAKSYSNQLEAMLKENLGKDYHSYIYAVLIPFYIQSGQYESARRHLIHNEQLSLTAHYAKKLAVNHLWWFKLDSAQAVYQSAIIHYQRYKAINDSLISETTKQRTALFEVQYQTRENKQKIIQLNQQARLKEIALQKAQTTRNFIIAGAVMLIILLGLVYNRFQLKQTSHQQLVDRQKVIDHKNSTLQILLTEKEWLLKEIHHRVKNNLQIVMSLLNSQASYLSDKAALSAIQVSQHRVQAMALIHQNLYQSDNVNHIDMRQYIQEIVTYLRDFYDLPQPVTFSLAVQKTHLTITEAIPVGLLINEAITNALKYAFPDERPGEIRVSFRSIESNKFELTIADNGIGLPLNPNRVHSPSLGMTLMHGFSMQLGGELTIKNDNGLVVHLLFSKELTDG